MKFMLFTLTVVSFLGGILPGCSTMQEAFLGRKNALARLQNVRLGHATRSEIIERFGAPDEINERRPDGISTEVFFYYDEDQSPNGYPELKVLACEFVKGSLTGYAFQEFTPAPAGGPDESSRARLAKGRTTRNEAENILGPPNGRSLMPTTLNLDALAGRIGGIPIPLGGTPENAKEIWFYNSPSLDAEFHRPIQQSLAVFFDGQGKYLGSIGFHQILGTPTSH